MRPARLIPAIVLALAVLAAGCRAEQQAPAGVTPPEREFDGPPRSFLLGFAAVPHELTDEAYVETYDFAARYGEVLLVQRPPAWSAFLSSGGVPSEMRDRVLAERDAAEGRGLDLVIVLDVFDPASRGALNALPESHRERGLDDEGLRGALVAEAEFIARNEQPAVLVIGNEINATFERDPTAFAHFLTAYAEAYRAVKDVDPGIRVTSSFQYEELLGVIPWQPPHAPRWDLLGAFEGRLDLFAVTTYPSFAYQVARKIPALYYRQIRDHTDLPVAFLSAGYSSGSVREGLNSSTEPEQRRYLELRLLEDADWLGAELLVWFAARDLAFATDPPYDLLSLIGLRDADDEPKEAWAVWEETARRPYDPAAAERARLAALESAPTPTPEPEDDEEAGDGDGGGEAEGATESADATPEVGSTAAGG